jgi:hypothetical protein
LAVDFGQRLVFCVGAGETSGGTKSAGRSQAQAKKIQAQKGLAQNTTTPEAEGTSPQATPIQKCRTPTGQNGGPQPTPTLTQRPTRVQAHAFQQLQPGRCLRVAAASHGASPGQRAALMRLKCRKRGPLAQNMAVFKSHGHGDDRHSKNGHATFFLALILLGAKNGVATAPKSSNM